MPRLSDLQLQDTPIVEEQIKSLDDLQEQGSFTAMLQPGIYGFQIPANVDEVFEIIDEKGKPWGEGSSGTQYLRAKFDDQHPLKIVEANPDPSRVGEPFRATIGNNPRPWKIGGVETKVKDFLYLLKKLGHKAIPATNKEYAVALISYAGKAFRSPVSVSWNCNDGRKARFWKLENPADPNSGKEVEVEQMGCGARYYTDGKDKTKVIPKGADGKFPEKIQCGKCGAIVRGFSNLDILREA